MRIMNALVLKKIHTMDNLYNELKKDYKYQQNLARIVLSLIYTLKEKEFDKEIVDKTMQHIKSSTSLFSQYRGNNLFYLSMLLCCDYDNPSEKFNEIFDYQNLFNELGLAKVNTVTVAYTTLLASKYDLPLNVLKNAQFIYNEMKKNHPWITDSNDFPLAILIAAFKNDLNKIEEYYNELKAAGFKTGNGLQLLAHILSFSTGSTKENVIKCKFVDNYLKNNQLFLPNAYYSALGMIALPQLTQNLLVELVETINYVSSLPNYKWIGKGNIILLASSLFITCCTNEFKCKEVLNVTNLRVMLNAILSAQNAALMASTIQLATMYS